MHWNMRTLRSWLLLAVVLIAAQAGWARAVEFARKGSPAPQVVLLGEATASASQALGSAQPVTTAGQIERLGRFLSDRRFMPQSPLTPVVTSTWPLKDAAPGALVMVGVGAPAVAGVPFSAQFTPAQRDEAYVIEVRELEGGRPAVFLCGKTALGLREAVTRFIAKAANEGKRLTLEEGREEGDPFINLRLLEVGAAARRQAPMSSPFRSADMEIWPDEQIRAYAQMFEDFGYNGIQVGEVRGYGSLRGADFERARNAFQVSADAAHARGLFVSLDQWGDCLYDEGDAYCWNDPKQHQDMLNFMDDLAKAYASRVDHLNIHIGDPGGCSRNGCTPYETPQQVYMAYDAAFRKINPKLLGTVSTWANAAFWTRYPEKVDLSNYFDVFLPPGGAKFGQPIAKDAKFLDETFSPKSIGIALNRFYNEQQADLLTAAGRPVDIWGWYIGDHEMLDNLAFNMKGIDEDFSTLPDKARDQIRSYTVEICFHGWPQVINTYVQSQKLWNPRRPLMEIEREFCAGAYGPKNADAVLALYQAVEAGWNVLIPAPKNFGTAEYNKGLRAVLRQSRSIRLAKDWQPNFYLPVPPQKLVDMLKARLTLILAVSEAKQKVDAARQELAVAAPDKAAKQNQVKAGSMTFAVQDKQEAPIANQPAHDTPVELASGQTIGQSFHAIRDFTRIGVLCATWGSSTSGLTITLYDQPGGKALASRTVTNQPDNAWCWLDAAKMSGNYYLELSNPAGGRIGVYATQAVTYPDGAVYVNGKTISGDPEPIAAIKRKAIKNLPELPIDPLWRQDPSIVNPPFKAPSFAEMIQQL